MCLCVLVEERNKEIRHFQLLSVYFFVLYSTYTLNSKNTQRGLFYRYSCLKIFLRSFPDLLFVINYNKKLNFLAGNSQFLTVDRPNTVKDPGLQ